MFFSFVDSQQRISADLSLAKQADRAFKEQKGGVKQSLRKSILQTNQIFVVNCETDISNGD